MFKCYNTFQDCGVPVFSFNMSVPGHLSTSYNGMPFLLLFLLPFFNMHYPVLAVSFSIFILGLKLISNLAKSSSILKGEGACIKQLQHWLGDKCKWNLCYRASRDGWGAQDFHRFCDNKGPTVVLIKVNNYIFGGFTDQNWGGKL